MFKLILLNKILNIFKGRLMSFSFQNVKVKELEEKIIFQDRLRKLFLIVKMKQ